MPHERADRRFNFACGMCGSVLEALRAQVGTSGRCPTCAAVFIIPPGADRVASRSIRPGSGAARQNPTPVHAYAAAGERAPELQRREDGTCEIVCPRCRNNNQIERDFCATCGFPFTIEGASRAALDGGSPRGVTPFIVALMSLPLCLCTYVGGVGSFTAGVLAWSELNRANSDGTTRSGRGLTIASLILSIVGLVICLVRTAGWI